MNTYKREEDNCSIELGTTKKGIIKVHFDADKEKKAHKRVDVAIRILNYTQERLKNNER